MPEIPVTALLLQSLDIYYLLFSIIKSTCDEITDMIIQLDNEITDKLSKSSAHGHFIGSVLEALEKQRH